MLVQIYNTILYQPLFNLLVFFYNIVPGHDIGVAIIMLTVFVKLVLWPFFKQSIKAQRKMQVLQPKLDELKEKYKDNKEKLGPAIMELYQKEKVNPLSSCFPLLIQLPFLIAVYQVFRTGLASGNFDLVYPFIANPGHLNSIAFGFLNLAVASPVLAVLTGLAQFWQSKQMMSRNQANKSSTAMSDKMNAINKQMLYFMPLITVVIGWSLPAGLTFYWLIFTMLGIFQQYLVFKAMNKESAGSSTASS